MTEEGPSGRKRGAAIEVGLDPTASDSESSPTTSDTRPGLRTAREMLRDRPEREPLIRNFLPHGVKVGVVGKPSAGKSWLTEEMAVAVASGTDFLDRFRVEKPGRVLLIDQDMSKEELLDRIQKMDRGHALDNIVIESQEGFELDDDTGRRALQERLAEWQPELVIVDCLSKCVSGGFKENSAGDVNRLFRQIQKAQGEWACTFVFVHHFRKNVSKGDPLDWTRGSSAVTANIDGMYAVHRYDEGESFTVRPYDKRYKIAASGFLARLTVDEKDDPYAVRWERECYTTDPEMWRSGSMRCSLWPRMPERGASP